MIPKTYTTIILVRLQSLFFDFSKSSVFSIAVNFAVSICKMIFGINDISLQRNSFALVSKCSRSSTRFNVPGYLRKPRPFVLGYRSRNDWKMWSYIFSRPFHNFKSDLYAHAGQNVDKKWWTCKWVSSTALEWNSKYTSAIDRQI